jgi:O-antigen/teichoic acid export membrane protein
MKGSLAKLLKSNALVSLFGNGTSAVLGVLMLGLFARWLPKEVFGQWMLFLTSWTFFDSFRTGFLLNALIRHIAGIETESDFQKWAGAIWQLAVGFTLLVVTVLYAALVGVPSIARWLGTVESMYWFAVLAVVSLPHTIAGWLLQSRSQFLPVQWIRVLTQFFFLIFTAAAYFMHQPLDLLMICTFYVLSHALVSSWVLTMGWSKIKWMNQGTAHERRQLLQYGKYGTGVLIGMNMLRTADIFILGSFIGPAAVASYTIPQRFIQLLEMPVRSIVITSAPRLAELHQRHHTRALVDYFHRSAGRLWFMLLPVAVVGFVFAGPLLGFLGGSQYTESAIIMRIFMLQGLLIPLERYSGVSLDAIGFPKGNLIKVLIMMGVSIAGNLLAVLVFQSVVMAAVTSSITFLVGLILGFVFMKQRIPVSMQESLAAGWQELRSILNQLKNDWLRRTA